MKKYFLLKQTCTFMAIMVLISSCNGQVNTAPPKSPDAANKAVLNGQPKLVKTFQLNKSDNVFCGLQDKAGNLWFGTTGDGVYRYDGKLFTNYTVKEGLSGNTVWSVLEDKTGNIWFGTDAGPSRYDGKSITPVPIRLTGARDFYSNTTSQINASSKNNVWSIMQDKRGIIWFGTDSGVFCLATAANSTQSSQFSRFLDDSGIINKSNLTLKSIQCMLEDKSGKIWFGSGPMAFEGIGMYDGKSLTNFRPKNEGWIRKIIESKNDTIFFTTRHLGVYTYDGKDFSVYSKPQDLRNDLLNSNLIDSKGNMWYTSDYVNDDDVTTGGIWKFDGKSFVEFRKQNGLNNTSVFLILEDRNGNIWFGTRNTGLYRYDGKSFTSFSE